MICHRKERDSPKSAGLLVRVKSEPSELDLIERESKPNKRFLTRKKKISAYSEKRDVVKFLILYPGELDMAPL